MTENEQVQAPQENSAHPPDGGGFKTDPPHAPCDRRSLSDDRLPLGGATGLLLALIFVLAAAKAILFDTLDPDCFWHLRVADELQVQGIGPIVDTLSFSSIKEPWTPYSWLAELGMKWVWDHLGWRGAVASQALAQGLFMSIVMLNALTLSRGRATASTVASFLGMISCLPFFSFRPVTFALVLLAICAWLIVRDHVMQYRSRAIWWIVPLTMITTNLHLSAAFVPLWCGCVMAGLMLENRSQNQPARAGGRYAGLMALTALACCCTPMLPGAIRTTLHYAGNDVMVHSAVIAEMQSFYRGATGWINLLAVTGLCIFAIRRWVKMPGGMISPGLIFWLATGAVLVGYMGRFAPMLVLIATPICAVLMDRLQDRIIARSAVKWALACTVFLALGRLAVSFPSAGTTLSAWLNRLGPETPGYPTTAADFVAAHVTPRSGRIINEFTWGGYLEWRLGDRFQTLLDGRTQVFSADFWSRAYFDVNGQRQLLQQSSADAAIVPLEKSRFARELQELGWICVHQDDRAKVFVPSQTGLARTAE